MSKKILIVDDEPVILKVTQSRLKANGFEVITAADGQEALSRARSEKPDLIILDIMLPKLDGYRVCSLLKLDENYKAIPILMLTARIHNNDRAKGFEAGADAYLSKPFEPEELLSEINRLLEKKPT